MRLRRPRKRPPVSAPSEPWRQLALPTLLVLSILSAVLIAAAQQPPSGRPVFRANVDAVMVDVRVVDRNGRFVSGLTKDDFRILEDDDEQTVTTFSEVNIPPPTAIEVASIPRVPPDVVTNGSADEGRLYLIVLDDLEAETERKGQYQALRSTTVKAIARDFVEHHMGPTDRAALIATSNRRELTLEFTADRRLLLNTIDKFAGGFGQVSYTTACGFGGCGQVRDNIHSVMINLRALAGWLSGIGGRRKAMVLVSERLGRSMKEVPEAFRLDLAAQEALDVQYFLQTAARGNVTLYAVDPVGNPTGPKGNIKPVPLDDDAQFDLDRVMTLTTISEATGGFATTQTNDYATAFARVVEDNSSYYLLGFVPTNTSQDGKIRKLRYEMARPGLTVRGRTGYSVAPVEPASTTAAGALPPALSELIRAPVPIADGLALSVATIPFRRDRSVASVAVAVEARASAFSFLNQDDRFTGTMALAIVVADTSGLVVGGERGTLTMQLSPDRRDAVTSDGVRMLSTLDLKPGRYVMKVAVNDAGGGSNRGSVTHDLVVPDFSKGALSMSGVALASPAASRAVTKGSPAALARWTSPFDDMPTTRRAFPAGETIRAFVEVYDSDRSKAHQVTVSTAIVDAAERAVFSREQKLPPFAANGPTPVAHQVATDVSLQGIEPGEYVLVVEARHSNKSVRPAVRRVPISVSRSPR